MFGGDDCELSLSDGSTTRIVTKMRAVVDSPCAYRNKGSAAARVWVGASSLLHFRFFQGRTGEIDECGLSVMGVALAGKRPAARDFLCSCKESHQRKHALHPSKPRDFGTRLGGERTRFAQTPFADGPQPRPEISAPAEGGVKPAYCNPASHPTTGRRRDGFQNPLLSRRFFRCRPGEVGEHCLSPKGELRSRPDGGGKIGHPKGGEVGA